MALETVELIRKAEAEAADIIAAAKADAKEKRKEPQRRRTNATRSIKRR